MKLCAKGNVQQVNDINNNNNNIDLSFFLIFSKRNFVKLILTLITIKKLENHKSHTMFLIKHNKFNPSILK